MLKIKKIEKIGRKLYIYFKIPFYSSFKEIEKKVRCYYDEDSSLGTSIDITGRCVVIGYFLRNKEDISPYVKNKR